MKKVSTKHWAAEALVLRLSEEGRTQEEFANFIGVRRNTIQNWESGRVVPPRHTMERVRAACNKNPATGVQSQASPTSWRFSKETLAHSHQALDMILENAPSNVVEETIAILDKFASRFGDPGREVDRGKLFSIEQKLATTIHKLAASQGLDSGAMMLEILRLGLAEVGPHSLPAKTTVVPAARKK